jgi:hypothetical protein
MRVCCNTDHGGRILDEKGELVFLESVTSLKTAMNQKTSKDLRAAMLRGERPDFCRRCYREEDSGGFSVRQIYNRHYTTALDAALAATAADGEIEPKVSYVDFSLSNNCNLQCRMCGPTASFPLQKEFDALGEDYPREWAQAARTSWNFEGSLGRIVRDVVPNLTEMLTTGGEPFLSLQHIKILETCISHGRAGEITLRYHSNLTVLPDRIVDLWRFFKKIEIHVSLEGVDEMNDYVRYPAKWAKIQENLGRLQQLEEHIPLSVEIHTCLQALSWLRTAELIDWTFRASGRFGGLFPRIPYPIWIDQPYPLMLNCLPPSLRKLGADRILAVLDKYQGAYEDGPRPDFEATSAASFRGAIVRLSELPYNEEDFQAFRRRTQSVDRYRKQDVTVQVPEFKDYFDGGAASL